MTAATVSDTVSRLTRCAEQASDTASAHTQHWEDPLELLQLLEADCLILDTALTVKTPEKLGFYSGPRRSIGTQSLWSSICRITMRTKRLIFLWKKVGDMFVDGNVCFCLSVNVDDNRWLVSKMTCTTCGRNEGTCRFGTSEATHVLTKCTGDALCVKLS